MKKEWTFLSFDFIMFVEIENNEVSYVHAFLIDIIFNHFHYQIDHKFNTQPLFFNMLQTKKGYLSPQTKKIFKKCVTKFYCFHTCGPYLQKLKAHM